MYSPEPITDADRPGMGGGMLAEDAKDMEMRPEMLLRPEDRTELCSVRQSS